MGQLYHSASIVVDFACSSPLFYGFWFFPVVHLFLIHTKNMPQLVIRPIKCVRSLESAFVYVLGIRRNVMVTYLDMLIVFATGKLERTAVLKALCAGFQETTEPPICLSGG